MKVFQILEIMNRRKGRNTQKRDLQHQYHLTTGDSLNVNNNVNDNAIIKTMIINMLRQKCEYSEQ